MLLCEMALAGSSCASSYEGDRRDRGENTMTIQPEFATVQTNGIRLRVALAGKGPLGRAGARLAGELVFLAASDPGACGGGVSRGRAGCARLWRQRQARGDRGVWDQGDGADIAGLVDCARREKAILIGHDWGAPIVWNTALFFPERVRAVAGLSVPHTGRARRTRIEMFRHIYKDRFFYQLYFQKPGVAEAELEADVRASLAQNLLLGVGRRRKAAVARPTKPAGCQYARRFAPIPSRFRIG